MILCYRRTQAQATLTTTHPTTTHRESQRTDWAVQRKAAAVLMAAALAVSMVSSACALLDTNPLSLVPRRCSLFFQQLACARWRVTVLACERAWAMESCCKMRLVLTAMRRHASPPPMHAMHPMQPTTRAESCVELAHVSCDGVAVCLHACRHPCR
jgi:hypothetical protein